MGMLIFASKLNGRRPRRRHRVGRWAMIDVRARLHGTGSVLGHTVIILKGTEVFGPVTIGDRTFINQGGYIRAGVRIGNDVAIGPFCRLITDSHEIGDSTRRAVGNTSEPIVVHDGAWLGACVTVLPGVTIGAGALVAAGSIVTRDVPPDTLVAGVPARVVRSLENDPLPAT